MKRDRTYYLSKSADLVSRQVYTLVKEAARQPQDLRRLKELCGVLKEAAGLSLSLEKSGEGETQTVLVTFEGPIEDYAG